ncbi:hypothetical protein D3C72_1595900 [compost metagenome]
MPVGFVVAAVVAWHWVRTIDTVFTGLKAIVEHWTFSDCRRIPVLVGKRSGGTEICFRAPYINRHGCVRRKEFLSGPSLFDPDDVAGYV